MILIAHKRENKFFVAGRLNGIGLGGHVRLQSFSINVNDVTIIVVLVTMRLTDAVASSQRDHRRAVVGARACHNCSEECRDKSPPITQ